MDARCMRCGLALGLYGASARLRHEQTCGQGAVRPPPGSASDACSACGRDLGPLSASARSAHAARCGRPAPRARKPVKRGRGGKGGKDGRDRRGRRKACPRLARLLGMVGLSRYEERFAEEEVDIEALREFADADWEELGVTANARRRIEDAVRGGSLLEEASEREEDEVCVVTQDLGESDVARRMRRDDGPLLRGLAGEGDVLPPAGLSQREVDCSSVFARFPKSGGSADGGGENGVEKRPRGYTQLENVLKELTDDLPSDGELSAPPAGGRVVVCVDSDDGELGKTPEAQGKTPEAHGPPPPVVIEISPGFSGPDEVRSGARDERRDETPIAIVSSGSPAQLAGTRRELDFADRVRAAEERAPGTDVASASAVHDGILAALLEDETDLTPEFTRDAHSSVRNEDGTPAAMDGSRASFDVQSLSDGGFSMPSPTMPSPTMPSPTMPSPTQPRSPLNADPAPSSGRGPRSLVGSTASVGDTLMGSVLRPCASESSAAVNGHRENESDSRGDAADLRGSSSSRPAVSGLGTDSVDTREAPEVDSEAATLGGGGASRGTADVGLGDSCGSIVICTYSRPEDVRAWRLRMREQEMRRHRKRLRAIESEYHRCLDVEEEGDDASRGTEAGGVTALGSGLGGYSVCPLGDASRDAFYDENGLMDLTQGDDNDSLMDLTQGEVVDSSKPSAPSDEVAESRVAGVGSKRKKAKTKPKKPARPPVASDADMLRVLRGSPVLYDLMLGLESVALEDVMSAVKGAGFRISGAALIDFLDRQGVTHKMPPKDQTDGRTAYFKQLNSR